jgi:V-type H+-transporting ATPase subunit a
LEEFRKGNPASGCSLIESLRLYVAREKYLYMNLNYLRLQGSIFTGNFWLPEGKENNVQVALRSVKQRGGDFMPFGQFSESRAPPGSKPPTYFNLNDFTFPFQEIVNTYGVPRY